MVFAKDGLDSRRCLITGAAGAIGSATARRFCEEGARVAISDLDGAAVEALATELGERGFEAHPLELDVTNDSAVATAVAESARLLGGLDTLIPNAGVLTLAPIEALSPTAFRHTLEVNLTGTFLCIHYAVPYLREARGGAIVCVASQSGLEGVPEATAYCASKFGVVGIVQSLARELTGDGIRVTGVAPGLVDTPMLSGFYEHRAAVRGGEVEELLAAAVDEYPIGRLAAPTEVADAILFLASDLASYISGATLPVIGGQVSH